MVEIRIEPSLDEKFKLSQKLVSYEECPDLLGEDFIYFSYGRGGMKIPLLKILLSNICVNDCLYCANRGKRKCQRYKFRPDEVVKLFNRFLHKGVVCGLFISSGIDSDPTEVQKDILKIISILRLKYKFKGYIHSKILPGAKLDVVEEIVKFSNRISLNLEAPGERFLKRIAPAKSFTSLYRSLKFLSLLSKRCNLSAGLTTQIIVGIGEEDDRTLLTFAQKLYQDLGLRRVYYSGFQPVEDTPLAKKKSCSSLRQLRLYQADFLIREYGYQAQELIYNRGYLNLDKDPKSAWAEVKLGRVNINKAGFKDLIRIPGIGKGMADKIIKYRQRFGRISLSEFAHLGIRNKEVLKFLTF